MTTSMPDFNTMTPEEMEQWAATASPEQLQLFLESLAKKAGVEEGLTTSADMEIREIDESTAVIDEPGYVPYSERRSDSAQAPAAPPSPPVVAQPAPPPVVIEPIPEMIEQPAAQIPVPQIQLANDDDDGATVVQPAVEDSSLAWLANIAAQSDNVFNLDLAAFEEEPVPADPEKWLQDIALSQGEFETASQTPDTPSLDTGLNWLETIALRRGAEPEEMITDANMEIEGGDIQAEAPAYTPFTFEMPAGPRSTVSETPNLENPSDWLKNIANSEGYSEIGVLATQPSEDPSQYSDEDIKEAISEGTVTPEQMEIFLQHQLEYAQTLPEEVFEEIDEEEQEDVVLEAEIPDWLRDLQEQDSPEAAFEPVERIPLDALFPEEETADEAVDLDQFISSPAMQPVQIDIDETDTWVEAFDAEHAAGGSGDIQNPPTWYLENISDPARIASVEYIVEQEEQVIEALSAEPLPPEYDLPEGEPHPIPAWMNIGASDATDVPSAEEMLETQAASIDDDSDLPEWMRRPIDEPDTMLELAQIVTAAPQAVTAESVVAVTSAPAAEVRPNIPATRPAPRPVYTGTASLESARTRERSGDVEGSLQEYEALVVNAVDLEAVVEDLAGFVRIHRENPTAFRLLGDGYMRMGNLQQALDSYREALNYL